MKLINNILLSVSVLFLIVAVNPAFAGNYNISTPGISGYDPVAYFDDNKPMRGSGWNVTEHKGITYAFANEINKEKFEASPEKYLPAYGGYCAYGVAVGKKFVADPEVWKIVDGKLYLNLDKEIQKKWAEDIPGNIKKADKNWPQIKNKAPSEL
ncbi:MAG: YHS domain protein [Deltaproteobacteria bacterium]|nr:MAG: YHS domain protein [Deltaproteobacteria bacterium]